MASGPLVACAGATPGTPEGSGGDGSVLGAGSAPGSSGSSSTAGSLSASGGQGTTDNPFHSNGGVGTGGNPFASSGNAGTLGSGGALGGQGGAPAPPVGPIPAGNVSTIAVGSLAIVARSFLLGRDAKGLYAMSLQCTHQGCAVVQQSGNQLLCPCHKSVFDSNGAVLVGPAKTPLPHFAVTVDADGNLTVDMYAPVGVNVRTLA